ncbi:MAG TPA: DUF2062 domain-containing protein [Thermoanaerobaculia bacterium]|nr:DUF2062 domain-containing protein [Thermoanaerobaculia bacterium]
MRNPLEIFRAEQRDRDERASRIGRVRRWLRHLPRRSNIDGYPVLGRFAEAARARPYLWSFRTSSIRRAIYGGAVIAFLPVYGLQIFLAFFAALLLRANLAVTCALQLITNPLSAAPSYYLTYRIGMWIIRTLEIGEGRTAFGTRVNALILGGIVAGLAVGLIGDLVLRLVVWEASRLRERAAGSRADADEIRARSKEPEGDNEESSNR